MFIIIFTFFPMLIFCEKLRVISTDSRQVLPPKYGHVELLNSSLFNLREMTLCGRFKTHSYTFFFHFISFSFLVETDIV